MNPKDERLIACLTHIGAVILSETVLGGIVMPLIVYLVHKDKSSFVAFHALQTCFFHLLVWVCMAICAPLCFVLIGVPLMIAIGIAAVVLGIIGCIRAYNGELWEYPFVGAYAKKTVGI